jgi:predicted O-methyltransferase YrrM
MCEFENEDSVSTYTATITKVRTLAWFLKRPRLFPQLAHLVTRKFSREHYVKNRTHEEARRWCSERALDGPAAIQRLTGRRFDSVEELFPQVIADAARRAAERPSTMGGGGDLDLLYALAEHLQATRVVETGVAYGWSSLSLLLSLNKRRGAKLISTDMPIPCGNYEEFVGCVVPPELASQWSVLRLSDRQALPEAIRDARPLDLCHYDSDKSYEGRMWAYPLLWEAMREGGIFVSDDIEDNVAFREFAHRVSADPIVVRKSDPDIGEKFIGLLVKRR